MSRIFGITCALLGFAAGAEETITVDQAIERALLQSPSVLASRERAEAAADLSRATRSGMLPAVSAQDQFQHYSGPFSIAFALPGVPAGAAPQFVVRDQNTNTLAVVARQPILGLARLSQDYVASNANADAAAASAQATERAIREAVETGFLRLYQARAAAEVAESSEKQLQEQVYAQNERVKAGSATKTDILRVGVAQANIHQQGLNARVQERSAKIQLLSLLGLPLDGDVEFAEPVELEQKAQNGLPPQDTGFQTRPELVAAARQADATDAQSRARLFSLLPDVDAEGAYIRTTGSAFAEQNSEYIGLRLSWPVWLWGQQWFAYRAQSHQARASHHLLEESRRNLHQEVVGRRDVFEAASAAIDVARKAEDSATEAYRVMQALVEAGTGTTTDLLDAQGALTQARLNVVRARYDQALAWVTYQRSSGE